MPSLSMLTPFGSLCATQTGDALSKLDWCVAQDAEPTDLLVETMTQLQAYCDGTLTKFDLPLVVAGGALQRAVCDAMRAIPLGETLTYGEIAREVGASAQAVGQACGKNPIPVIIPCHRVMGAGGKLTGFSGLGGVETKVALLRHERAGGLLI
ncbi:MAG: methylated-DNA--[protein]-cysteine S-methyltransferase [Paracoccaceae bacterium]